MLALDRVQGWLQTDRDKWGRVRVAASFLAAEHHYLGGCHAHGLLKMSGGLVGPHPERFNRMMFQSYRHRFGGKDGKVFVRFETPNGEGSAAAAYVAKYVVKQDLDWRIIGSPVKRVNPFDTLLTTH